MIESWLKLDFCRRTLGFWHGYHFQTSIDPRDHLDPEFCKGWMEGMDLLFDERRAAAEFKARQK